MKTFSIAAIVVFAFSISTHSRKSEAAYVEIAHSLRSDTINSYDPAILRVFCNGHELDALSNLCDNHIEDTTIHLAVYDRTMLSKDKSCGEEINECEAFNVTSTVNEYIDRQRKTRIEAVVRDEIFISFHQLLLDDANQTNCTESRYLTIVFTCDPKPLTTRMVYTSRQPEQTTFGITDGFSTQILNNSKEEENLNAPNADDIKIFGIQSDESVIVAAKKLEEATETIKVAGSGIRGAQLVSAVRIIDSIVLTSLQDDVIWSGNASETDKQATLGNLIATASNMLASATAETWKDLGSEKAAVVSDVLDAVDKVGFVSIISADPSSRFGPTFETSEITVTGERYDLSMLFVDDYSVEQKNGSNLTLSNSRNLTAASQETGIFTCGVQYDSKVKVGLNPNIIANANQLNFNDTLLIIYSIYNNAEQLFLEYGENKPRLADANSTSLRSDALNSSFKIQSKVLNVRLMDDRGKFYKTTWSRNGDPVVRFSVEVSRTSSQNLKTSPICAYWHIDEQKAFGYWRTSGCWRVASESNYTHTVCECSHLTSFAVLVDYTGSAQHLSDTHASILSFITIVGCLLSCVCLALTCIVLSAVRALRAVERNKLHLHLCITLLVAVLVFTACTLHNFAQYGSVACRIAGSVLHYLFLATFAWFAVEGIYLYITLVLVFSSARSTLLFRIFCAVAYCVPVAIVGVTNALWSDAYGPSNDFCWLRYENGYIWMFLGPVCCVLCGNFFVFCTAVFVICAQPRKAAKAGRSYKNSRSGSSGATAEQRNLLSRASSSAIRHTTSSKANRSNVESIKQTAANSLLTFRKWCKTSFVLVNLLGLSWVVGLLYFGNETVVFAYLFTIINSLQGAFLFLLYVALDKKVINHVGKHFRRPTLSQSQRSQRSNLQVKSTSKNVKSFSSTDRDRKMPERKPIVKDSGFSASPTPTRVKEETQILPVNPAGTKRRNYEVDKVSQSETLDSNESNTTSRYVSREELAEVCSIKLTKTILSKVCQSDCSPP